MNNTESTISAESIKTIDTHTEEVTRPVELSKEEQMSQISENIELNQQKITSRTESADYTKSRINEVLGELDLPKTEEDPPSVVSSKTGLEKLIKETELLEKQRIELMGSEEGSAEKKEDDKKEGENKEVEKEEPAKEQKEDEKEKISE
jgi:hypothetical protein